jgi:hypothetical protein
MLEAEHCFVFGMKIKDLGEDFGSVRYVTNSSHQISRGEAWVQKTSPKFPLSFIGA